MSIHTFIMPHNESLGLEMHLNVTAYDTKMDYDTKPRVIEVSAYMHGKPLGFVPEFLKSKVVEYARNYLDCSTIKFITYPQHLYN